MKRRLYNIINEAESYQFYKDDSDEDPVEIDAKDEKDAEDKIEKISKRNPDDVTYWKKTKDEGMIRESNEPEEEDITLTPSGQLGSNISVGIVGGKHIGEYEDQDAALAAVKKWMEKNQFWPTIWWVSDHGNSWPIDLDGNELDTDAGEVDESTGDSKLDDSDIVWMWDRLYGGNNPSMDKMRRDLLKFAKEENLGGLEGLSAFMADEYADEDNWDAGMHEINSTSNLDGGFGQPKTPNAFQRKTPSAGDKRKELQNATSSTGYGIPVKSNKYTEKMDEMRARIITRTNEVLTGGINRRTLTEADTSNRRQINLAIKEVYQQLSEIERVIDESMKLREDTAMGNDVFYKPTLGYFTKISERMLRIGSKLRELNK